MAINHRSKEIVVMTKDALAEVPPAAPDHEAAVRARYTNAARAAEPALCCPTRYDERLLAAIPAEVLERDYGCGDPTRHVRPGEVVLDLGSGAGKACFLAAQVVGPAGRVIGVDMNDGMLAVARRHAPTVAERLGYANVEFRKGRIQDLNTDLEWLDAHLALHPVSNLDDLRGLEWMREQHAAAEPLVASASVDVVVSNCVLNLVRPQDKAALFAEVFRVLRRGGRAVISDIVSDEEVPARLQRDPDLWSGCISGALHQERFLEALEEAGFYGISILERQAQPWRTVEGIEFRSLTVAAWKGKQGPCLEGNQAVIYRGPFRMVEDDDGHRLRRGVPVAVCAKTFALYQGEPYRAHFDPVPPLTPVELAAASPFACARGMRVRDPRETKGAGYDQTTDAAACGGGEGGEEGGCC